MVMLGFNTPSVNSQRSDEGPEDRMFHHRLSLQAGAYQNATYVVAVAKAGVEDGHPLIGGSMIVDPNGKVVAETATEADEMIVHACDLDECNFGKSTIFDFKRHRRIEHYRPDHQPDRCRSAAFVTAMFVDFTESAPSVRYKLLTATVIPRPIALVTTRSGDGVVNAAPFSFFNVFSEDPALVILGLERRRGDEALKDTTQNLLDGSDLVVNLVDRPMAEAMVTCAGNFDPDTNELDQAGLTPEESRIVGVPGIAEAPVRLECRLWELRR